MKIESGMVVTRGWEEGRKEGKAGERVMLQLDRSRKFLLCYCMVA
jgi:hypothetical protein